MASHGAAASAGSDAPHAEVVSMGQTNPSPYPPLSSSHQPWSSVSGSATVSWNNPVDKPSQDTIYYDPQRDVSVAGGNQNVGSSAPHVAQSSTAMTDASNTHMPYSSSVQHGYNPVEYANYYYSYPQATNDSSVQQGANQHPGAAYQPLTSFQNSGSYIDPTSNTYYNAGGHQTLPGYGSSSYYYQNNTWNGGSSGNNYAQSYQNYSSSDTNALQSSTSMPANSVPYQQQYNQWPYYYNQSVPSASSNPVAGKSTTDNVAANTPSGYSYPSSQPPPPGTTSWKSNPVASVAPPMQAPGVPGPQNQYANQAQDHHANQAAGVQWSQNHYAYQAQAYPQKIMNSNHAPLSNPEDQQRTVEPIGRSSNTLSNHVSENFQPNLQGSVTTNISSESKIQIPTNPRIAPGFSMAIPKSEKKNLVPDLSKKPAYVSVSMPTNDAKATQDGPDARSIPFSLRTYITRNINRCKDDAQRASCRSIMAEITRKAITDGTLLTKNWDTESLLPLPESAIGMTEASSANHQSPFSSTPTPRKRVKSRWEPVDEKATIKVEQIAKGLVNSNIHNTFEPKSRTGSSWDHGKFLQSRQAPLNKVNQRPAKKQKINSNSSQIQNGNASSDSDKEQDLTKYYASATALANSPEEKKRREHRSKRFERCQDSSLKSRNSSANKDAMANIHRRRAISSHLNRTYEEGTRAVEDMDWDSLTIKGTCQEIEKGYLRLTSAPDPSIVRPEDVLEKALAMVETSQRNYFYKCDQLKSIRQDLTVQRIQNELTVKVYETHARLAMQAGDLPEYNQCQSQLKRLYAEGIKGCYFEFSAYSLLCVMLHSNNKRDLLSSMASLSKEAKQDAAVKHALAVHAAVLSGNYVLFFRLYKKAPNLNSCLMDLYVERMRFEAMKCMSRSYRPSVPMVYVAQILGFLRTDSEGCTTDGDDGLEECEKWMKAHGAVLSVDNSGEMQIDMKSTSATLYMPEPENAVAHGDSSLAVEDFLARTS